MKYEGSLILEMPSPGAAKFYSVLAKDAAKGMQLAGELSITPFRNKVHMEFNEAEFIGYQPDTDLAKLCSLVKVGRVYGGIECYLGRHPHAAIRGRGSHLDKVGLVLVFDETTSRRIET